MSLCCLLDLRNDICDTCLSIRSILSRNSMKVISKFNTFRDILEIFTHPYISKNLFLKKENKLDLRISCFLLKRHILKERNFLREEVFYKINFKLRSYFSLYNARENLCRKYTVPNLYSVLLFR